MDNHPGQGPPIQNPAGEAQGGRQRQQPSPPTGPYAQQQQQQQRQASHQPPTPAGAVPVLPPPGPPPGPPQLPPQLFTTAAQLLDLTDKKLVLVLRDGRKLIGVLRSWDQFANIVLQDTVERIYAANKYADLKRGVFLVRGENVLLLGEIDLDKEDEVPEDYEECSVEEALALRKKEDDQRKDHDKKKNTHLQALGFEPEHSGEILF
ncbi:SM-like, degradation of cytoplasmic mRNAs and positively regulates transcription initiation [Myotisia sp. PD_48]|nr:SM-like, degradation of cytoplasmic mRNAs and positively regulates transcription initiation [Myotisia sp. PD_48]